MNRQVRFVLLLFVSLTGLFQCKSGLVTTSNACYNLIKSAQAQNKAGDFSDALANFNEVLKKCDAYDAKAGAYGGKAEALNGLKQYSEALAAAQAGLKIDKNNVDILFQQASAELGLDMKTQARADLEQVTAMTQKNVNKAQRATIYAKIAALDSREQQYTDAITAVDQAISIDDSNLDFYVLKGDIYTSSGNFSDGIKNYDLAISKGKNDASAWKGKIEAMVKMNQKKYATTKADVLAAKMSSSEKSALCESIRNGQQQGLKDMNIDLIQLSACK